MGKKAKLKALRNEVAELRGCLWPCRACGGTGMKDTHPCEERQASVICPTCKGLHVKRTMERLAPPASAIPDHYHLSA